MRSSVSVILSSAPPDTTMSFPDYLQTAADHSTLLVLVRHLGQQLKPKAFSRVFDIIQRLREIKVTDHQGNSRILHFRYKRSYPVENNEWGDFQTHRRVLGLISVGKCSTREEVNEICQQHESVKVRYNSSIYDSRCIIFGINNEDSTQVDHVESGRREDAKSARLFYPSTENCEGLVGDVTDFISSLFWVLESKRVSLIQGHEKAAAAEKLAALASGSASLGTGFQGSQLICAPFERKDFIGVDMDSRSNKKRCLGRAKKQQGDLCLQAGVPFDAIIHYSAAAELLRAANDWLWLGGTLEGIGSAAGILHYPTLGRYSNPGLQRNSSFNIGDQGIATKHLHALSQIVGGMRGDHSSIQPALANIPSPEQIIDLYKEAIIHYSKYRHAGIIETEASLKVVHILVQQDKPIIAAEFLQNVVFINLQLPEEEKIQRFVTLAGLYEDIGFRRKAAFYRRVAAMRCVSPQNTNPSWTDCYQLLLQCLDGYKLSLDPTTSGPQLNSSSNCVWTERNSPNCLGWPHLQTRVLEELIGSARRMGNNALAIRHMIFLLHMMLDHSNLKELQDHANQLEGLTCVESVDGEIVPSPGVLPVPLALDSGVIIPPVHLTNLPRVKQFDFTVPAPSLKVAKSREMKRMAKERRRRKLEETGSAGVSADDDDEEAETSPFIVSSLKLTGTNYQKGKKNKENGSPDFYWVVDEKYSVTMELDNPLPMDLKISKLALLTEGVLLEVEYLDVVLAPLSSMRLLLRGIPKTSGKLRILGYTVTVLGVTSNCRLRNMKSGIGGPDRPWLEVEVVPGLPMMEVTTTHSGSHADDVSCYPESLESASPLARGLKINMYAGEKQEVKLKLRNITRLPIEAISSSLESSNGQAISASANAAFKQFIVWDEAGVISDRLPIAPDDSLDVILSLDANASGFIGPPITGDNVSNFSGPSETGSAPSSLALPAWSVNASKYRFGSVSDGQSYLDPQPFSTAYRSLASHQSFKSSCSNKSEEYLPSSNLSGRSKVISVVLNLDYSGGPGFSDGYCRKWSISISLHIFPSVCVTGWDVLPAGTSQNCYLVLDVQNATNQEMELTYKAPNDKCIAIEPLDSCRIPIPVVRCPLNKVLSPVTELPMNQKDIDEEEAIIAKTVAEHLANLVELCWVLPFSDMRGRANLKGITLTSAMAALVRMPPVSWRVSVNGFGGENGKVEEVCAGLGSMVDIVVELANSMLGRSLVNLSLEVRPYLPSQCLGSSVASGMAFDTSTLTSILLNSVAVVGSDTAFIPSVPVGGTYRHRMGLVFCAPGIYKLSVKCRSQSPSAAVSRPGGEEASVFVKSAPGPVWEHVPAIDIIVREDAHD